jgi:hypothetical protein
MSSGILFGQRTQLAGATSADGSAHAEASGSMSLAQLEAQLSAPTDPASVRACKPYDEAAFLSRLSSFRAGADWFDKPAELSPPQCARFGWVLAGHDLLTCPICNGFLKAPAHLDRRGAAAEVGQMVASLTTAHGELCPWRRNPSPASIASLLLPGQTGMRPSLPHGVTIARDALRRRTASLLALPTLPALHANSEAGWKACAEACGYGEDVRAWREALIALTGFERGVSTLSQLEQQRKWTAAALAISGYAGGSAANTMVCAEDARTIGLWSFASLGGEGREEGGAGRGGGGAPVPAFGLTPSGGFGIVEGREAEEGEGEGEGRGTEGGFDPVAEHRSWSPWTACAEGDHLPAWVRIVTLLLPQGKEGRGGGAAGGGGAAAVSRLLAGW